DALDAHVVATLQLPLLRAAGIVLPHEGGAPVGESRDNLRTLGQRCHHFYGCKVETRGLSSVIVRNHALRRLPVPLRRMRCALLCRAWRLLSIAPRGQRETH